MRNYFKTRKEMKQFNGGRCKYVKWLMMNVEIIYELFNFSLFTFVIWFSGADGKFDCKVVCFLMGCVMN